MEKYGFVYLWYDKKHKRYYIGCRWGNENDGYICSSTWMKQGYRHRPNDFKRRILSRVHTNRKDLLEEEYRWLSKIKEDELGKRYYNLDNHHFGHWSSGDNADNVRKKVSDSHKGKQITQAQYDALMKHRASYGNKSKTGQKIPDVVKEKMRQSHLGHKRMTPDVIEKIKATKAKSGYRHSEETRQRMKVSQQMRRNNNGHSA